MGAQSSLDAPRRGKPSQRVMQFLLGQIGAGGLAAGERLPTERDLAAHLGVSRSAVREALTVLMTEGRIAREIGRGTFVAALKGSGAGASRSVTGEATFADATVTETSSPARIIEARLALEPQLAAFAVLNGTPADLRAVADACEALSVADSAVDFEARDEAFHRAIATATQNTLLIRLYDCLAEARRDPDWQKIKEHRFLDRPERRPEVLAEHRRLVERLRARDPEGAREAMVAHLASVRVNLLGY